ncbi:tetratricopeptide repeat protein [Kordiimonas lacus]|uniref:Tetratricopeptide repeat-containing protein n=1 Tax=Kordiimonas lacus TaxID=637679 RepID=A0A1G7CDL1_9PROT|nr:tetratricopeptide repeat protein [Kordiimonas lacus]SDE37381.1 Tetratricopeptide repeat-containing protein [Kordiimonas lacus]
MWTTRKSLVAGAVLAVASFSAAANAQTFYAGPDRNIERGTDALMQGDLKTASKYFHRAAETNLGKERLVPLLNNLCAVDYALGKLDSAEEACSRAIAEDRHFWRAYVNRGNVLKAKGEYADAHQDYAKAVRLKPKSDIAQRALARLQEEQPKLFAAAK